MAGQECAQRVCVPPESVINYALYVLISKRNIRYVEWSRINGIQNALRKVEEIKGEPVSVIAPYFYRGEFKEFTWNNREILKVTDDYIILLPETTLNQIVGMGGFAIISYKGIKALKKVENIILEGVPKYKAIPPTPKVVLQYLKATGHTTQELEREGISTTEVEEFFANRIPISKNMAKSVYKLVSNYPGIDAEYWMRYDSEYRTPVN